MTEENTTETTEETAAAPAAEPDTSADDWAAALDDQNKDDGAPASFDELGNGAAVGDEEANNLDFLLDIPLKVTVELGNTSMIINDMLQLSQGSVVELNKGAGEPVEIFVNNKLLGKGEVIVVNDRFGVRITEIISQAERIKNMG